MNDNNMTLWNAVKQPPTSALKTIGGGRLKGMTDINPQWRLQALTEYFGQCGVGWKYTINKLWTEPGSDGQVCAFALISLYYRAVIMDVDDKFVDDTWSAAIPGIGGSMLVENESRGLHTSDEAYKMAVTDAISVAAKALGFGSDIYMGKFDGTKYRETPITNTEPIQRPPIAPRIQRPAIAPRKTEVKDNG